MNVNNETFHFYLSISKQNRKTWRQNQWKQHKFRARGSSFGFLPIRINVVKPGAEMFAELPVNATREPHDWHWSYPVLVCRSPGPVLPTAPGDGPQTCWTPSCGGTLQAERCFKAFSSLKAPISFCQEPGCWRDSRIRQTHQLKLVFDLMFRPNVIHIIKILRKGFFFFPVPNNEY